MSGYKTFFLAIAVFVFLIIFSIVGAVSVENRFLNLSVMGGIGIIAITSILLTKERYFLKYYFNFYKEENEPDYFLIYTAKIISLDGHFSKKERKKVKEYLTNDYGENYFFKLKNLEVIIGEIDWVFSRFQKPGDKYRRIDRLRLLQRIVRLAVLDRYLSKKEKELIELATENFRLKQSDLKVIFRLYNYVTEEETEYQRLLKSKPNYTTSKAFSVLGLETSSSILDAKEAYRELVKIYHPDKLLKSEKNKEFAKQQFQAITDAYVLLKEKLS